MCCGSSILEADLQRAALELRAHGAAVGERGRKDDSPLLAPDPDDQLGPDLAQADVVLVAERDRDAEHRAPVLARKPVGELGVQHVLWAELAEELAAEAVEHLVADDLGLEVARPK